MLCCLLYFFQVTESYTSGVRMLLPTPGLSPTQLPPTGSPTKRAPAQSGSKCTALSYSVTTLCASKLLEAELAAADAEADVEDEPLAENGVTYCTASRSTAEGPSRRPPPFSADMLGRPGGIVTLPGAEGLCVADMDSGRITHLSSQGTVLASGEPTSSGWKQLSGEKEGVGRNGNGGEMCSAVADAEGLLEHRRDADAAATAAALAKSEMLPLSVNPLFPAATQNYAMAADTEGNVLLLCSVDRYRSKLLKGGVLRLVNPVTGRVIRELSLVDQDGEDFELDLSSVVTIDAGGGVWVGDILLQRWPLSALDVCSCVPLGAVLVHQLLQAE
jgi:hypothetical protein